MTIRIRREELRGQFIIFRLSEQSVKSKTRMGNMRYSPRQGVFFFGRSGYHKKTDMSEHHRCPILVFLLRFNLTAVEGVAVSLFLPAPPTDMSQKVTQRRNAACGLRHPTV